MATLHNTSIKAGGVITPIETTLTASDVLIWDQNTPGAILVLRNPTGGALSPTITGASANPALPVPGYGPVSAAALAVGSIPAGATRVIPLDSRREYLQGTITITGGVGLVATILTN